MRKIVICFGQGREETIAHYERECSPFGSRTATQRIIHDLQWAGLVFLRSTEHTRALCVIPSERLVLWYIASARDIRKLIKKRLQ